MALSLLEAFPPIFDPLAALTEKAHLYRHWGDRLLEDAALEAAEHAERLTRRGRLLYRRAAVVYEEISRLRIADREYADELWRAAENFLDGHSFSNAVRVLRTYLASEAVARRPQALVKLGEAHLAQGDLDRALAALEECIELHGRDASVYAARVLCARANAEKSAVAAAEQLLRANLTAQGLTPASREWRESLLELGKLKYMAGEYPDAIRALREYVERYDGEEPNSLLARYFVAQCYRHAAREPLARLAAAITENERLKHRTQAEELLIEAVNHFSQVQRTLTLKNAEAPLDSLEQAILRNCYLLRGDVLFSMKDYEKSLEVFRNASSLYQHDPVVLDAYLQIASCHRRLGQLQEARGAIEQAKIVLSRMPGDANFTTATGFGKEQWSRVLSDMSNW
jgi:tetratricopeptide (TPR) repeat protein